MVRSNIRQIEAFNAVMKGGSVTKAAEMLFVSQPAISKLVQQFESSCGFPLFHRGQGRLLPTPEARRLFAETEKFMTGVERIGNTARAIRENERGEVTVAAFPALGMRLLPRMTASFLSRHPEVGITILTQNSPDISQSMAARAADFGISLVPSQAHGIQCRPFADMRMLCALPASHRLAGQASLDLAELNGESMISLGRDDFSHRDIVEALSRAGARVETRAEVQMADSACVLVSEGFGFAIVPVLAQMSWTEGGISFVPIRPAPRKTMWLYTSAWEPPSAMAELLIAHLRDTLFSNEIWAGPGG
ncbi:LysR substrate-binding domain-containing protein [Paracoccus pacificus]|uniref:LysR substrate-binding domain-containing protein n=1 Tax=Paracoccus pacificus TaxID=1463598 RepID=A0ABW4RAW7_9RHOB